MENYIWYSFPISDYFELLNLKFIIINLRTANYDIIVSYFTQIAVECTYKFDIKYEETDFISFLFRAMLGKRQAILLSYFDESFYVQVAKILYAKIRFYH